MARTGYLRAVVTGPVAAVVLAVMAAFLMALVAPPKPAEAAFPGGNGKIVFSSSRDGNAEIYTMNPDGSNPVRLTNNTAGDTAPAVSADGKKIAFVSSRDGNAEIYAMNADGSNQVRLTSNSYEDTQPAWSPNGSKIAFTSTRNGDTDVYSMNADGSGQTTLTSDIPTGYPTYNPDDNAGDPAWSPNGQQIAYTSNRCVTISSVGGFYEDCNYREVLLMSADGTYLRQITSSDPRESCQKSDPAWAPNGQKLAWASNCQGFNSNYFGTDIWVADLGGSSVANRLTGPGGNAFDPAWSPDGQKIAYKGYTSTSFGSVLDIYVMNSADGSGKIALTNTTAMDQQPDWQPTDNTPPNTTIGSGPSSSTNSTSASFSFSSSEANSTFECSLDDAAYAGCTSPRNYSGLAEGSHTFRVRATDAGGNADPTPASQTWTVDTTKSTIDITTPAEGATYGPNEVVNADYACTDESGGSGVKTCEGTVADGSPIDTASEGTKTFTVTATDNAGNTASSTHTYTVAETTKPTVASKTPADGKTNITLGTNPKAVFSEQMDPETIDGTTFTLAKQGSSSTPIAATVTYDEALKTAKLDPTLLLENGTTYIATITTGAEDLAGNALAQEVSWTFTTVAAPVSSCTITGTSGADVLQGTEGADTICGLGGNDTIRGLGGNDTIQGGDGNDTIEGGQGDDTMKGENNSDKLHGGEGNDTIDGGAGTDYASFKNSTTAVQASLSSNTATGEGSDTLAAIEHLEGSNFNDTLTGSSAANTLTGLNGLDAIGGGEGNDTITGGAGNDTLSGGSGNDKVTGSGGADVFYGEDGDDALNSKDNVSGNDALDGGAGTDTCTTDASEKSITSCP